MAVGNWTKSSDWLPYDNALAQRKFWLDDLIKAESALNTLDTMNVNPTTKGYIETKRQVQVSRDGVARATEKLEEAIERINRRKRLQRK